MLAWSGLSFSKGTIWKEKTQLVQELFLALLFQRKGLSFLYIFLRQKGELTGEHNMEEAYITKGFNN